MKVAIALALLSIFVVVRSETCTHKDDCTMTSCVDSTNTIDCLHHECTCTSGNTNGGCTTDADCHHHHQTHCQHGQNGQHAVCQGGSCTCV